MPPKAPPALPDLGKKLAKEGPYRKEHTGRRVRGLFAGKWVFDTTSAVYVWEHEYYPYFYLPLSAINDGDATVKKEKVEDGFWTGHLTVGDKDTPQVLGLLSGPLSGLVKVPVSAIDAWYAEDEHLLAGHPRDPYKRIECLPSSREVRIEVRGKTIARSSNNIFLFETSLRPRYYLSPASIVDWGLLRPTDTETLCPYKGQANYYDLAVDGDLIKDAVWYYKYPVPESASVQGRLCFYNEKVDIFIDGQKESVE